MVDKSSLWLINELINWHYLQHSHLQHTYYLEECTEGFGNSKHGYVHWPFAQPLILLHMWGIHKNDGRPQEHTMEDFCCPSRSLTFPRSYGECHCWMLLQKRSHRKTQRRMGSLQVAEAKLPGVPRGIPPTAVPGLALDTSTIAQRCHQQFTAFHGGGHWTAVTLHLARPFLKS